jgi:hypothetical protein
MRAQHSIRLASFPFSNFSKPAFPKSLKGLKRNPTCGFPHKYPFNHLSTPPFSRFHRGDVLLPAEGIPGGLIAFGVVPVRLHNRQATPGTPTPTGAPLEITRGAPQRHLPKDAYKMRVAFSAFLRTPRTHGTLGVPRDLQLNLLRLKRCSFDGELRKP